MDDTIQLGYLRDGRLRVIKPMTVEFKIEGPHVIAEVPEINEFGFGDNQAEALIDLQHTIGELYFVLKEKQDCLGPDTERIWRSLQESIREQGDGLVFTAYSE